MNKLKEALLKIQAVGFKNYLNSMFTRSYGKSINYVDDEHIVLTSENITFYMKKDGADYYLTVQDVVYLVRYVRFLSFLVSFLIILTIILIVFWS